MASFTVGANDVIAKRIQGENDFSSRSTYTVPSGRIQKLTCTQAVSQGVLDGPGGRLIEQRDGSNRNDGEGIATATISGFFTGCDT